MMPYKITKSCLLSARVFPGTFLLIQARVNSKSTVPFKLEQCHGPIDRQDRVGSVQSYTCRVVFDRFDVLALLKQLVPLFIHNRYRRKD